MYSFSVILMKEKSRPPGLGTYLGCLACWCQGIFPPLKTWIVTYPTWGYVENYQLKGAGFLLRDGILWWDSLVQVFWNSRRSFIINLPSKALTYPYKSHQWECLLDGICDRSQEGTYLRFERNSINKTIQGGLDVHVQKSCWFPDENQLPRLAREKSL